MALILPKGIVVNSAEIGFQIERINAEPLDLADIAKFWKVYTTTKRRLLDPTAERLENYWWRIWGSRKRELNGATVARLFAYISDGHSFVPLRGPANRDEGSPPLKRTARHGAGATSAITLHRPSQSRPSTTSSSTGSKAPVVMPHPILKKTRGPSTTGPRPTARFISPHESEDETDPDSSVSPNSHVVVQPPSPDYQIPKTDKKMAVGGGSKKKSQGFVASTAAKKKKKPVIVKRQSSQSSTDSAAKGDTRSSLQSSTEASPTAPEESQSKGKVTSKFQENFPQEHVATLAPRKRQSTKSADSKRVSPRKSTSKTRSKEFTPDEAALGDPGPSTRRRPSASQTNPPSQDLTQDELAELESQRLLLEEANARVKKDVTATSTHTLKEGSRASHKPPRTSSHGAHEADSGARRLLAHDSKSTASLAATLADATGQIDLGDLSVNPLPRTTGASGQDKGKARDLEDERTEMFAKRPVPPISGTGATTIPDGSLARSKSQLTLLLEKDRVRSSGHKSSRDEEKE